MRRTLRDCHHKRREQHRTRRSRDGADISRAPIHNIELRGSGTLRGKLRRRRTVSSGAYRNVVFVVQVSAYRPCSASLARFGIVDGLAVDTSGGVYIGDETAGSVRYGSCTRVSHWLDSEFYSPC